jgi:hypothetical protein
MSRPVLQVTLDEQMYLEILKLKADFSTASSWNTSGDWKDRLIRFAQNVVVKSRVFTSVEILSPFEDDIVSPKPNQKKAPVRGYVGKLPGNPEDSPVESVKDYV